MPDLPPTETVPTLIFDGTRLFWNVLEETPRGIDRVDVMFATALIAEWPGKLHAMAATPWGLRLFDRATFAAHITALADLWGETGSAGDDRAYQSVLAWLDNPSIAPAPRRQSQVFGAISRVARLVRRNSIQFGQPAGVIAGPSIYLNLGQSTFGRPAWQRWRDRQTDCTVAAMIHDVIPLSHPDLVSATARQNHVRLLKAAASAADLVLTPSDAERGAIASAFARLGLSAPPIAVTGLAVDDAGLAFRGATGSAMPTPGRRYFVAGGSIEPRKNQRLLIDLWKDLLVRHPDAPPALVLAGQLTSRSADILAPLAEDSALARAILVAPGLSSPALNALIRGAEALLMPSLAEGFGLQPLEAIALGTPPIVSDIAAHREATAGQALYVAPDDRAGWLAAIDEVLSAPNAKARWAAALDRDRLPDIGTITARLIATLRSAVDDRQAV